MTENIKVVIRFRPLNKREKTEKDEKEIKIENTSSEIIVYKKEPLLFTFDSVFSCMDNQQKIFDTVAKNVVEWVCQGYNGTIFAYGATSSGKSYTMFGDENNPGIVPKSCDLLFSIVGSNDDVIEANLKCSFIEIYQERLYDLLQENDTEINDKLKLRQNGENIYIQGLIEKYVYSPQEILSTIKTGMLNRTTCSTSLNSTSSRSHAVLTLTLTQKYADGTETKSKLHLIDLAGSENVGRSEVQGTALTEAQTINKSLSCLGNVIFALTEKNREHIPYRDSKLTYLLQDSLGGNSKTVMICTVTSAISSLSETISTLRFAKRAKEIQNKPKINRNESIENLLKIIEEQNKKISELENELKKKGEEENNELINEFLVNNKDEENVTSALLQLKCNRLEKTIEKLEKEVQETEEKSEILKLFYEKQRSLSQKVAKELYNEKLISYSLHNELEQYKIFYDSLREFIDSPQMLQAIVSKTRILKEEPKKIPSSEVSIEINENEGEK